MPHYCHSTTADIPALVQLWNSAFGPQWPLTERLLRQTMVADPYYEAEGCWVAREGDQLVGWVLSKSMRHAGPEVGRFQGRGGIGALCVHPHYQRQGIASSLLDLAEGFLRANGSAPGTLYYPHHLLPGIPADCEAALQIFRARGYTGFSQCHDLVRDLAAYELPARVHAIMANNPDVALRPGLPGEAEAIIAFVEREFPGGWPYSTRGHFARGGDPADIIVAVEAEEVIGFCHTANWRSPWLLPSVYWHELLGPNYGGLGPIGIAKAQRKRGLGLALCAVAVESLRDKGVGRMGIDWTTLVDFYGQLGCTVWKTYLQATRLATDT